jgi:predicted enzyme related to lactoylglutathione lyase
MTIRTSRWPAGVPCWADLSAPDLEAAKRFYGTVLGWTFEQFGEEFGGYALAQARGAAAAGIGPQQPGAPVAWTMYIASDDADATAAQVTANGGTIIVEPGDVGPLGRMFIAADPSGAMFGVWDAKLQNGAGIVNEPGGLTWEDLRSTDPEAAIAFYSAVFGYVTSPLEMAGPDYALFQLPDEQAPLGGMGGMMGHEGVPSHWLVYFGVADAVAAAAAVRAEGGEVLADPFETPFGWMAAFRDPGGAVFWIVQTLPDAAQPDRSG